MRCEKIFTHPINFSAVILPVACSTLVKQLHPVCCAAKSAVSMIPRPKLVYFFPSEVSNFAFRFLITREKNKTDNLFLVYLQYDSTGAQLNKFPQWAIKIEEKLRQKALFAKLSEKWLYVLQWPFSARFHPCVSFLTVRRPQTCCFNAECSWTKSSMFFFHFSTTLMTFHMFPSFFFNRSITRDSYLRTSFIYTLPSAYFFSSFPSLLDPCIHVPSYLGVWIVTAFPSKIFISRHIASEYDIGFNSSSKWSQGFYMDWKVRLLPEASLYPLFEIMSFVDEFLTTP